MTVEQVSQILSDAESFDQQMRQDSRFSPEYKAEAIQQRYAESKEQARALAQRLIAESTTALQAAEEQFNGVEAEYANSIDNNRLGVAHVESQTLAATVQSFREIEAKVTQAIARKDVARLQSLRDIALPLIVQRAGDNPLLPLYAERGALVQLGETVIEALAELEPEGLKTARQKAQQAKAVHDSVVDSLKTIDYRHSMRHGGSGLLNVAPSFFVADYSNVKIKTKSLQAWP